MNEVFDCMDESGDSMLEIAEVIEQKTCYRKYRKLVNVIEFFECVDGNDSEASREDALQKGCECIGL